MMSKSTEVPLGQPQSRHPTYRHDFGFLPVLERLCYDPDKPFHFGIGMLLNASFGISGILVCANCSFSMTYDEVSRYQCSSSISESARSRSKSLPILAVRFWQGLPRQRPTLIPYLCIPRGEVMETLALAGADVFVECGRRVGSLLPWRGLRILLRGPHCPRQQWVGWQGGMTLERETGSNVSDQSSRNDCENGEVSPATSGSESSVAPTRKTARANKT
ncbi:hypothetical protein BDN67DRAFT_632300 [Paxillus ammoniavirescens]|nr:hypothetical protein BDN67DRAFT_632300 [Paxillus ammoniavirescens]